MSSTRPINPFTGINTPPAAYLGAIATLLEFHDPNGLHALIATARTLLAPSLLTPAVPATDGGNKRNALRLVVGARGACEGVRR